MKTATHALFGVSLVLQLYIMFPSLQSYSPLIFGLILAFIGSTIPDLDHPANPGLISFISKHRGWTHSIFGAIVFTVLFGYLFMSYNFSFSYVLPFFIGYISHLALDSLTPTGVKWYWPYINESYTKNWIVTGSKRESLLHSTLIILLTAELLLFLYPK